MNEGVDTVISLRAGLDTRPYRLPVTSGILWIEVDFPAIISYKEKILRQALEDNKLLLEQSVLAARE